MPALPLKGIFAALAIGIAGVSISTVPQLLGKTEIVPRFVLGRGGDGKELYIRLVDLKTDGKFVEDGLEEDEDGGEGRRFIGINLWLDNLKLDLRGGKHSLESPNKDGKYYLLESKENKKFLGGKEIPDNDTRSSTLKQYANDNPNYIQLEENQWVGFTKYDKGNIRLEKIQSCAYSIDEEGESSSIFVVCHPHQYTGRWNYRESQYVAKKFERQEMVV